MRRTMIAALAVGGMLLAASLGYAAFLASRDSVGLPVTKLEPAPRDLSPTLARRRAEPRQTTNAVATRPAASTVEDRARTQTRAGDDHSGRGGGSGSSGRSGSGAGGSGGSGSGRGGGDD